MTRKERNRALHRPISRNAARLVRHAGGGVGGLWLPTPSFASSAAIRAFSASFSSRASRAMSLTASNSSRLTRSRSRSQRSAWVLTRVSNSRRTPWATPAASFISRATSSKKRLVVWVMTCLGRWQPLWGTGWGSPAVQMSGSRPLRFLHFSRASAPAAARSTSDRWLSGKHGAHAEQDAPKAGRQRGGVEAEREGHQDRQTNRR